MPPGRVQAHDQASWELRRTFDDQAAWVFGHGRGITIHGSCTGPSRAGIVLLHGSSRGAMFSFRMSASIVRRPETTSPGPQGGHVRADDAQDLSWALPSAEADRDQTRSDRLVAVIGGLHRLMSAGRFGDIDRVLRGQTPRTMSPDLMQAYVRTTASVRSKLTHWTTSVHQMHAEVASRGLKADRIFVGLL